MIYEVTMQTKPGMFEQYESTKRVNAKDKEEAITSAWWKIKRDGFRDHSRAMWKVVSVTCIGN